MLEQIAVNMEFRGGVKVEYYHIKDKFCIISIYKKEFAFISR